ncbi:MAG TPA: hypothetical protein VF533_01460 [Solirubrobacteraceae bacterium]
MPRNLISELVQFILLFSGRRPRRLEWDPGGARADGTPATVLHLFDQIPRPPFRLLTRSPLKITSKHERLTPSHFGPAAGAINDVGAKGHGRTITCVDPRSGPIAALAFHLDIDKGAPLLVSAIAVLETGDLDIGETSRSLAGVLLCYLADAALERGLPDRLGFAPAPDDRELALRLGFRPAGTPAAYADAGDRYLEWRPPRALRS